MRFKTEGRRGVSYKDVDCTASCAAPRRGCTVGDLEILASPLFKNWRRSRRFLLPLRQNWVPLWEKAGAGIPIPKTNSYNNVNLVEEYSLNCNNFNPSKMSPPDDWKCRLQQRIQNYYHNIASNEKNKWLIWQSQLASWLCIIYSIISNNDMLCNSCL